VGGCRHVSGRSCHPWEVAIHGWVGLLSKCGVLVVHEGRGRCLSVGMEGRVVGIHRRSSFVAGGSRPWVRGEVGRRMVIVVVLGTRSCL
jgi:hypothetical protein